MTKQYERNKKWCKNNPDKRHKWKTAYRQRTGSNKQPTEWTAEQEELVLAHTIPDRQLAKQIGHSVTAIHIKRNRLKNRERINVY